MRKPILLAAAVLLLACAAGRGADSDEKLVQELRDIAKDTKANAEVRITALDTLAKLGPKAAAAVPDLIKLLGDTGFKSEDDARYCVAHTAQALGAIGPGAKDAVPALVKAKTGYSGPDTAIDSALKAILQPPAGGKPAGSSVPVRDLLRDLKDKDENVRLAAAKALGKRGSDPVVLSALLEALKDPDPDVRRAAEESAKKVREAAEKATRGYVARLAELLKDKDAGVRVMAAKALGTLGPSAAPALPALKEAAGKDADADVKFVAKNAVEKIERNDGKPDTPPKE